MKASGLESWLPVFRPGLNISAAACFLLAACLYGQDSWEVLPDVPFTHGVSCGGGLATDGTYIYAADFSGDGNNDYIDLDDNGAYTAGEYLDELGIPNGSVRIARYDPATATWDSLPTLNAAGVGGDAFSRGDFNGSLFHADGQLYYYQFRAGPNRCALYRYNLVNGLAGSWTQVWDLDTTTARINGSAGLTGAVGPNGPVILHHEGGGAYRFARSTGIDGLASETHIELTPSWPYTGAHFPRNGAWEYDPLNGSLYHMSGNQLLRWDPSSFYAPDDFTTAVPDGSNDLAVFSTAITSLKDDLGWDPGGSQTNPGASLWGNDIVVVNDPTGLLAGPAGEDTGANVVYLVRGETSESGWPYNEGRGVVNNGDFARYFPDTGNTQNLPDAPFHVGKGANACYLDGYIYLLQGETKPVSSPSSGDGIKRPGMGFARFSLLTGTPPPQESWESLSDVPFPQGVSCGGGMATDGTYIYAADLSGDGNNDYIDLDDNGAYTAGEYLDELGIPNGSVRIARYDPATATWDSLPTLNAAGVGGDAFSGGDFNGSLFHADGKLYYYQFRAGPNRCALYRYDLSTSPGGSWTQVWDLDTTTARINGSAGLTGAVGPNGPVILHHEGGGAYHFARSTGIDGLASETHIELTPSWPYTGAHFPRNGAWEYDPLNGSLYHMSGNQLLRWDPSSFYAPDDFTTAVPDGSNDLAVFSTAISSLKDDLGWDPGGSQTNPGASLWGNDIVVVNDPTGLLAGPAGEDTGANVVYLVRGETSESGWPYNEGRGVVSNGDFARYFPDTGNTQNLPDAPFHVGKGANACYLDGYIYLLQGETKPVSSPSSGDGIKRPGMGFARFNMRPASQGTTGSPVIPVGDYIEDGFANLTAPADTGTGTSPLFDGDWSTSYEADSDNPVEIIVEFVSPKETGAARCRLGDTPYEWSLDAANTMADLISGSGSHVSIFSGESVTGGATGWYEWNAGPVSRSIYRFTVERLDAGRVIIRELELQRPLPAITIQVGGSPVSVNYLEIVPENPRVEEGSTIPLTAEASLSLGPDRYDVSNDVAWTSSNQGVATVDPDGTANGLSEGASTIGASLSTLAAETDLTVVTVGPRDDDVSVAWIRRLPVMDFVWGSSQPDVDGWPAVGSTVTWRAMVKNWYPFTRYNVGYRWLLDGSEIASGRTDLDPSAWTPVDLPRTWSFTREELTFEIDPLDELAEVSEGNNDVTVFTDAITVGFWVEDSVYDYFHDYQHELGIGSNGWEDWAQRQVGRWNQMFADAIHPVDAPDGVLDRIRIDKITIVEDGALPLQGGSYPTNYPDTSDRTVDLMWGFPATLLDGSMYDNHTALEDWNHFYFEGSLIHELGHARYLIDCYGFNVVDSAAFPFVHVTQDGSVIAGTPYLPRTWAWWDHVHIVWAGIGNPYEGLMTTTYTFIDRYSAAALNRIAGHRATMGNYNAPNNIGEFRNDLPLQNTVQLFDGRGHPIPDATVSVYQATGIPGGWYAKEFDDVADLVFQGDANGFVDVGRNPFAAGPLEHTYGISNMVALLKVESGTRTGFAFLEAGLFNMEHWRGHTDHGYYALTIPMLSAAREIAFIRVIPSGSDWRIKVVASGDVQPDSVVVDGQAADYQEGSWWGWVRSGAGIKLVTATWPGGPTVSELITVPSVHPVPAFAATSVLNQGATIDMDLQWTTRAGDAYGLEWSPDLQNWSPVPGGWIFGDGAQLVQPTSMPGPGGYYRMQVYPLGHRGVDPY